ncbi:MAG: radical SAM protein [Flavipsychrobacter sp.]|nr:radical SAM protein [Flavipsychrobacter sp.]
MKKFALNKGIAIRQEFFGCLIFDPTTERFYQYNQDAFKILKYLKFPATKTELILRLKQDGLKMNEDCLGIFLDDLKRKKVLVDASSDKTLSLFTEISMGDIVPDNYLVAPTGCTIYVTEFCSKRCLHCIVRSSPNVSTKNDLTIKEWQPIFIKLREWGVFSLIFTGGEPLLKKDIFEILGAADKLGFDLCLLSDYDGINQTIIDKLKQLQNLNYIQVSLDGASELTHDFLRGKGSFNKSIKRIKLFIDNGFEITVSSVIHKNNYSEVLQLAELCKGLGVKYLYLNPIAPYGRAKEELVNLCLSDHELYKLGLIYYYIIRVIGISSGNQFWENLNPEDVLKEDFFPFKDIPTVMSSAIFQLSINSSGDCYLDSKMKSENLFKLGNAITDDLKEMWNSEKLKPLRKTFTPGNSAFIKHSDLLNLITT